MMLLLFFVGFAAGVWVMMLVRWLNERNWLGVADSRDVERCRQIEQDLPQIIEDLRQANTDAHRREMARWHS